MEIIQCTGAALGVLNVSGSPVYHVDLSGSSFSGLQCAGCTLLLYVDLSGTNLDSAAIDQVIADLAACGTYSGTLDITMTAGRTSASDADVTTLTVNGWIITE